MTGPTILPDYGAQLADALARLGKGAGQIINPHGQDRAAFRKAVAANPAILQDLRDMVEIQPPEEVFAALKNFVPQDLIDVITNMDASPGAIARKQAMRMTAGASPELLEALGASAITGQPPIEATRQLSVAPLISQVAGQRPDEVGPTAAERGAYRTLTGETTEEGAAGVVRGDAVRLAGLYLNSLSPERRAQIGSYAALPELMRDEQFIKQLELQERIWQARNRDRINDTMARLAEQNIIWWQQNTGTGSTEAWRTFFSDQGRKRLEALNGEDPRRPITSLTSQDRELLEVQRAFQAAPAERRALDLNRADAGIRQLVTTIGKADDASVRAGLIAALNQQLTNKARLTGTEPYHAAWAAGETARGMAGTPGPAQMIGSVLSRFKRLRFYDSKNNEVSSEIVEASGLQEPPTNTRGMPGGTAAPVTPSTGPAAPVTKEQRWNELRRQMFPNTQRLTPAQVDSVTARVNLEFDQ